MNELFGGWTCKANCECEEAKFIEEMNDLCMSLGDCGMSVNYMGNLPGGMGYSVKQKGSWIPKLKLPGLLYLPQLLTYSEADPDFHIDAGDSEDYFNSIGSSSDGLLGSLGIGSENIGGGGVGTAIVGAGRTPSVDSGAGGSAATVGTITGGVGAGVAAATFALEASAAAQIAGMGGYIVSGTLEIFGGAMTTASLYGFGGALAGAGIGMAVAGLLIEWTGVGRGMPAAMTYGLVGAAGVGGAIVGIQAIGAASLKAALASLCAGTAGVGCIIVVVVIIIIALLAVFGIGDVEIREYTFNCNVWQPPLGGANCEMCGSDEAEGLNDNLQCSKYACESLGQSCEFIEEEPNSFCIDNSHDDVSGPVISAWSEPLTEGFEYRDSSSDGFSIRKSEGEECLTQFESVEFSLMNMDDARLQEMGRLPSMT